MNAWICSLLLCFSAAYAAPEELKGPDPSTIVGEPAGPPLSGDALEAKTREAALLLRCPVCQNQTLADSNADLAVDLRRQIREQLRAGY